MSDATDQARVAKAAADRTAAIAAAQAAATQAAANAANKAAVDKAAAHEAETDAIVRNAADKAVTEDKVATDATDTKEAVEFTTEPTLIWSSRSPSYIDPTWSMHGSGAESTRVTSDECVASVRRDSEHVSNAQAAAGKAAVDKGAADKAAVDVSDATPTHPIRPHA